jgi:hypothetical protein
VVGLGGDTKEVEVTVLEDDEVEVGGLVVVVGTVAEGGIYAPPGGL